ncbi:MAG: hypothetical protein AB7P20_19330 [Rhizobiaceae bacterium]
MAPKYEDPVAKSIEAAFIARNTGMSNGSMAAANGLADRRREREREQERQRKKQTSTDENSKVICTELHRQGLLSREDHPLGLRYVREHLTPRHERGYHVWAIPVVRRMRQSKRVTAFWHRLAKARADHIAYLYGDDSRRNRCGQLLCAIGHPACYLIGGFVDEQNWRSVYQSAHYRG